MNVLENVKIYGVWGWKDFNLSFKPDVNFLIGVNGTGKTTVIQIIASALT
ncbi:MAG: ATP-binding protein, partial [Gemmatimonadota bacterium]|nr:ATP-binding protein [Gemmatimonadota bacterium]